MKLPILLAGALCAVGCATANDEAPVTATPAAAPVAAAQPVDSRPVGERLYGRHCLSCHQADGRGVPDMQPAIAGGSWVTGDARALALFVMSGGFNSAARKDSAVENVMPEFRQLPDADLAEILTFIRQKFGAGASRVSAAEVAEARATLP